MLAIITINYNLSHETIPCIESLLNSDYTNYEIVLIDNGSSKSDYQILFDRFWKEKKIKIVRTDKNLGYVGGVNLGLAEASKRNPDHYMVMNNDTVIEKSAIKYLIEAAERHGNKAIITGKVYYYDQPDVLQHTGVIFKDKRYKTTYYPGQNEKDIGQCDLEVERDSLDDVFWIIPKQIYEDVGPYCNYFYLYAEQGDYCQMALRKGYKLIYTPKAKIWHKVSMTVGAKNKFSPVYFYIGQGQFLFQYRNLKLKYFIISQIRNYSKLLYKSLFRSNMEQQCSKAILRGYLWGLRWLISKQTNEGYNPYIKKI